MEKRALGEPINLPYKITEIKEYNDLEISNNKKEDSALENTINVVKKDLEHLASPEFANYETKVKKKRNKNFAIIGLEYAGMIGFAQLSIFFNRKKRKYKHMIS